jgi:P27 family predicted phage terminase small subunit
MKARPPKPRILKLVEGDSGHRPLPADEPRPEPGIPSCPRPYQQRAKQEWRRITKELEQLGLITKVDRAALAAYCQSCSRWIEAEKQLETEGPVIEGRQRGLVKSPWVRIAGDAMEQIRRFGSEFGLTPSSRGRLQRFVFSGDRKGRRRGEAEAGSSSSTALLRSLHENC